jgi:glyoxylase-like metal-dependent hydrolase (beta-lactamase superfamily II)
MKRIVFASAIVFAVWIAIDSYGAELRFEKVSDHCYYLPLEESGDNVAVIATDDGVLMVNPPQEPGLSLAASALKSITSKPVRWVVFTDPHYASAGNARFFAEQNSTLLASSRLWALSNRIIVKTDPANQESLNPLTIDGSRSAWADFPELIFDHQMHLFPSNLEIRIWGVQAKARTGGDVVAFVPDEKVLFVGDLFETERFPDIDTAFDGSALGWIEGLKQVIQSVPLLKSAIPEEVPEGEEEEEGQEEEEKTLEEKVTVLSTRGKAANLQNMKDLLEISQKLRNDIAKAIRTGRTRNSFLASSASKPYRSYGNLSAFAARLFEELDARKLIPPAKP